MNAPDFYNLFAKAQGVPDGWRWYELRVIGDAPNVAFSIKGAVCTALYKSGKWKGHTNWNKRDRTTERQIIVTPLDFDAFVAKWESDTGLCSKCGGDGQELASISKTGSTGRDCTRCRATGRRP